MHKYKVYNIILYDYMKSICLYLNIILINILMLDKISNKDLFTAKIYYKFFAFVNNIKLRYVY